MSISTHARLALLRQPLRVREARADHEQRVAALHHVVARHRAEQADRAGHERQVVGERRPCRAAPWRRRRRAARRRARPPRRRRGAPWPTSIATFSPSLRIVGRVLRCRTPAAATRGRRVADARVDRAVRARRRLAPPSAPATSSGTMIVQTPRRSSAIRQARSTRWRACAGTMQTWTYSETSLNRTWRSTSCW